MRDLSRNRGQQLVAERAMTCQACGCKPEINPDWLNYDGSWIHEEEYWLGCVNQWWGLAASFPSLEEAIQNWNHHCEYHIENGPPNA